MLRISLQLAGFLCLLSNNLIAQISFSSPQVIYTESADFVSGLNAGRLVDMNGDGRLDYLFANSIAGNVSTVLLEQGAGGDFTPLALGENGDYIVSVGDYDDDGDQDYLGISGVYENDGSNMFLLSFEGNFPFSEGAEAKLFFAAEDINGDQVPDFGSGSNLSVFDDKITVFLSDPIDGYQEVSIELTGEEVFGSFNLFGTFQDVASTGVLAVAEDVATIYAVLPNELTAVATIEDSRINNKAAAIGDIDGDGDNDVIMAGTFSGVYLWRQEDNGFPSSLETLWLGNLDRVSTIKMEDVDSDGDLDLLTFGGGDLGEVLLFENEGNGNFLAPTQLYEGGDQSGVFFAFANALANVLSIGDVNNDGDQDIVVYDYTNKQIIYLENTSVPTSVSVAASKKPLTLDVFPNPGREQVNVRTPFDYTGKWSSISLKNINGKILQSWEELPQRISLTLFPQGVYILTSITTTGQVFQTEIIKAAY